MSRPPEESPDPNFPHGQPGEQPGAPTPDEFSMPDEHAPMASEDLHPWWQEPQPRPRITLGGTLRFLGEAAVAVGGMVAGDIADKLHGHRHELPGPMTTKEAEDWNLKNGFPKNWRL